MRYRSFSDRKVSVYGALLLITIIGATATLLILHRIANIDFTYAAQASALGY